jgi:hypothetical protein
VLDNINQGNRNEPDANRSRPPAKPEKKGGLENWMIRPRIIANRLGSI